MCACATPDIVFGSCPSLRQLVLHAPATSYVLTSPGPESLATAHRAIRIWTGARSHISHIGVPGRCDRARSLAYASASSRLLNQARYVPLLLLQWFIVSFCFSPVALHVPSAPGRWPWLRCYGGVPEEWCFGVQRDVCDSSFEVRIIRVHRPFGDVFYAVCIYCLTVKFGIAW